jgi:hypothetical protein
VWAAVYSCFLMTPVCLCIGTVKFAHTSYPPFRCSRAQSNVDGFAIFCIIHSFCNVLYVGIRGKKGGIVLVWTCCRKRIILVFGTLYNIWNCTHILSAIRFYITRSGSLCYRLRIVLYGKWGVERWRASNSLYFALGIQTYQSFWNYLYLYTASEMKWCFIRGLIPLNWCVVVGSKACTRYQWWNECDNNKAFCARNPPPPPTNHGGVLCINLTVLDQNSCPK